MAINLNELRDRVHQIEREREANGNESATDHANPVVVDREGVIHLNSPSDRREVSRVPIEKFAIDLNALRDRVHQIEREREANGDASPTERNNPVVVDREGGIHLNSPSDHREVSQVPIEKFAASRLEKDKGIVRTKLPRNTVEVRSPDYGPDKTAWIYKVTTSFGTRFSFFAVFDGTAYQVRVIEPEIEAEIRNPHTGHIFADGRICFGNGPNSGMPSLESAFAKSVLWAEGISVVRAGGTFPFNFDQ